MRTVPCACYFFERSRHRVCYFFFGSKFGNHGRPPVASSLRPSSSSLFPLVIVVVVVVAAVSPLLVKRPCTRPFLFVSPLPTIAFCTQSVLS